MTTRVKVDDSALRKEIERNPEMKRTQFEVAEEIMARSVVNTPRGKHLVAGRQAMRQTFFVRAYRDYVRTGSTSSFFHLVEYGSVNNRAYAPIRRAVQSLGEQGIHFKEKAKAAS